MASDGERAAFGTWGGPIYGTLGVLATDADGAHQECHDLHAHGVHIWDAWAEDGELGPIYGAQWRRWRDHRPDNGAGVVDQIAWVVQEIQRNPTSRRLVVSAWNVADLPRMALPPCHVLFQFFVEGGRLSCQVYQRSADAFIGLPWNIASYAVLTHMVAQVCDLAPGELVHTLGDVHLYRPHLERARVQLRRTPFARPQLALEAGVRSVDAFTVDHFTLLGYQAHPAIKACVAV